MPDMEAAVLIKDLMEALEGVYAEFPQRTGTYRPPVLIRAREWLIRKTEVPDAPGELPSWVQIKSCSECGQDFFFARLPSGKWLALVPYPINVEPDEIVVDSVYIDFSSKTPTLLTGKLGTRYIPHSSLCNRPRPEDPITAELWDKTYGVTELARTESLVKLWDVVHDL